MIGNPSPHKRTLSSVQEGKVRGKMSNQMNRECWMSCLSQNIHETFARKPWKPRWHSGPWGKKGKWKETTLDFVTVFPTTCEDYVAWEVPIVCDSEIEELSFSSLILQSHYTTLLALFRQFYSLYRRNNEWTLAVPNKQCRSAWSSTNLTWFLPAREERSEVDDELGGAEEDGHQLAQWVDDVTTSDKLTSLWSKWIFSA